MSGLAMHRALVLGLLLSLSLAGCATRDPQTLAPQVVVARGVTWHVSEGDVVTWRVYNDVSLSGTGTVAADGTVYAIGLGRVQVDGLNFDSLNTLFAERYDKIIRDAAVVVGVQRDLVIIGPNRPMALVLADPSLTVLALLAKAGNQAGQLPIVSLVHPDGSRELMPRDARIGSINVTRADGIYVEPSDFLTRNIQKVGTISTFWTAIGVVVSVIGIFIK